MKMEEMIVVVSASATQELCNKGIIKKDTQEALFVGMAVGLLTCAMSNYLEAKDNPNILEKLIGETLQFRQSKKRGVEISTGFYPSMLGVFLSGEILSNTQILRLANLPDNTPNLLNSFYKRQIYFAVLSVVAKALIVALIVYAYVLFRS